MAVRTALLIRCTLEEARIIRQVARDQCRTISGYILFYMKRTIDIEDTLVAKLVGRQHLAPIPTARYRASGRRTAILVRCSVAEARRVRAAAKRRETTISTFVLYMLHRSWPPPFGPTVPPPQLGFHPRRTRHRRTSGRGRPMESPTPESVAERNPS